jgi:hypothetical protein
MRFSGGKSFIGRHRLLAIIETGFLMTPVAKRLVLGMPAPAECESLRLMFDRIVFVVHQLDVTDDEQRTVLSDFDGGHGRISW